MRHFSQAIPGRRFDSWKEIACFFQRDERTVRRWEKERALPVHRIPGAAKGRVFAFESELQEWLSASEELEQASQLQAPQPQVSQVTPAPEQVNLFTQRTRGKWFAASAVVLVLMAAVFAYRSAHRFAVQASARNGNPVGYRGPGSSANSRAEGFYLQGRYYWNKRTPDDLHRAVDYFTQAIVQDPNYAKAYVGLADSYNLLREFSAMPPNEAYPRALAAATKAVELDDSSAEAHSSLAFVTFFWNWDAAGADREFQRALALNPNDAQAHHWYASFLLTCRRFPESLTEIENARRLDPSSAAILADQALILHSMHRTEEAAVLLKQIEAADPSFASAHRYMSEIYFARKDYSNYLSEWEKTTVLLHDENEMEVVREAEKGFAKGGYEAMLEGMLHAQRRLNAEGAVADYSVAMTYARLRRKHDALHYLQASFEKHECLLILLSNEPTFAILHEEPEYQELVARISPSPKPMPPAAEVVHQNQ
jgi:tetratricopeptide (TPR) repeat protein